MGILTSTVSAGAFIGTASYAVQSEFLNGTQSFQFVASNELYTLVPTQSFISKNDVADQNISASLSVGQDLFVAGNLTVAGQSFGITASHLIEQHVAIFSPIETPQYVAGGMFRSTSGDWFLS